MVVDAVIRKWFTVVALTEAGAEGLRENIQDLASLFYAYDGLVAPTLTERLQIFFTSLINRFDRVSLYINMRKTVSMDFWTCNIPGGLSESAYMWQVTGVIPYYQERL